MMSRSKQAAAAELLSIIQPLMRDDVQAVMDHAEMSNRELAAIMECSEGTVRNRRIEVYACLRVAIEFIWGPGDE